MSDAIEVSQAFSEGCLWEDVGTWTLITDCDVQEVMQPCRHCHSPRVKEFRYAGSQEPYTKHYWTCPFVVSAENEGGHNSTGICLSCIIEAILESKFRVLPVEVDEAHAVRLLTNWLKGFPRDDIMIEHMDRRRVENVLVSWLKQFPLDAVLRRYGEQGRSP